METSSNSNSNISSSNPNSSSSSIIRGGGQVGRGNGRTSSNNSGGRGQGGRHGRGGRRSSSSSSNNNGGSGHVVGNGGREREKDSAAIIIAVDAIVVAGSEGGGGGGGAGSSNSREIQSETRPQLQQQQQQKQQQQQIGQHDYQARVGERGRGGRQGSSRGRSTQQRKQQQQQQNQQQQMQFQGGSASEGQGQDVNINGRGERMSRGRGSGRGRGRGRGGGGRQSLSGAGGVVRPQDKGINVMELPTAAAVTSDSVATTSDFPPSAAADVIAAVTAPSQQKQHQHHDIYFLSSSSLSGLERPASVAANNIAFSSSTTTTASPPPPPITTTVSNPHLFDNNTTNNIINNTTTPVFSGGGGVIPSHPPIFMSRMNTHLSLDNLTDEEEVAAAVATEHQRHHFSEEDEDEDDHIARQLAKGLLLDDYLDQQHHTHQDDRLEYTGEQDGVKQRDEYTNTATKASTSNNNDNNKQKNDGAGNKRAQLVTLPLGYSLDECGNVLPIDESKKTGKKRTMKKSKGKKPPSAAAAGGGSDDSNLDSASSNPSTTIATATTTTTTTTTAVTPTLSASEAIKNLNVKEVSIGESTTVKIKQKSILRRESSKTSTFDDDSTAPAVAPVINLLVNSRNNTGTKITGTDKKAKGKSNSSSTTKSKKLNANKETGSVGGGGGGDEATNNLRAARRFNRLVLSCVERSDPDGMREILRNKHNHKFALDAHVLETVMKAYVMAAMFEDALYCLRNCTLPGTLSTLQTERILQCLPQNLRNSSAYTAVDMIDALCIATKFDVPTTRTYFMRIARGISLEFLQEATSARDRICSAPCERLVRSAHCVVDARLRRGKKPCDLIVEPGYQLGIFIPDTQENRGMQSGDAVSILPYAGPYPMSAESLDRNMIEATVTNAMPLVLRLQDKGNTDLYQMLTETSEGNVYRIDKLANRMGFTRQLSAVISVVSPIEYDEDGRYLISDRRHPSPELIKAITAMDENIDQVMMAGGNLHLKGGGGNLTSTAAICSQAVSWRDSSDCNGSKCDDADDSYSQEVLRTESLLALEKYGALEGLNASQRLAVQGAASNRLTLVQGPPGTGKTAVAIRILQHWARLASARVKPGENPLPILATSDSNIAVDNLVEGCANVGLRVVRLGRPEAIRPELLQYCIDRPTDRVSSGGGFGSSSNFGGLSASMFKDKMKILNRAQVVCCTCIGSGGDILDSMAFERVMVDEATQATEPAVLVPLTRGCRQLVLVGDHCQLPPTVLSTRAEEEGLGVPLFSRMVACGVLPFMLDTQYRMHPAISMFPSDLFYGGKLNDGVSPPERRPLQGFPWPREEFPVAFVPVVDSNEIDDGVSKANEQEAVEVCHAVVQLLNGGQCTVSDIAVVTPYSAQVRLIRRQLRSVLPQGPPFVEVSSTDGFQGREKEAVIFSAVRSNSHGTVGFVSDWRRINVSFTRARRALIVVGNPDTLRRGDPDTFGAWLQWADAHGVNMMSPGKPRGRYEPEVLRKVRGGTTAAEMLKDVLDRQQAQLKTAEQQQARAVVNAAGHIIGKESDIGNVGEDSNPRTLKDDLALLENSDGCWDDSDDDADGIVHSSSFVSMVSSGVATDTGRTDVPLDAWDL